MKLKLDKMYNMEHNAKGLHKIMGINDVVEDEDGQVSISVKITEDLVNPLGNVHGGTLFALCDIAAGAHMSLNGTWGVTLDAAMDFYRPAKEGETLTAVVDERKRGKTVSIFLVSVYSDTGKHIADSKFTMFYKGEVNEVLKKGE